MPAEAADWIYSTVLTIAYRRSAGAEGTDEDEGLYSGPGVLRTCPCQWGVCHACQTGQHTDCVRGRIPTRAAYVLGVNGQVAVVPVGRTSVFAAVWLSGRQCGWRCACGCAAPPEQVELFALASAS